MCLWHTGLEEKEEEEEGIEEECEAPIPVHTHIDISSSTDGAMSKGEGERELDGEASSVGSEESFHSTVEVFGAVVSANQLYLSARELVDRGGVKCRKIRWVWG